MAKITIKPRKDKENKAGEWPINIVYSHGGEECWISACMSIHKTYWNEDTGLVSENMESHGEKNALLRQKKQGVESLQDAFYFEKRRYPNKPEMRELYDSSQRGAVGAGAPILNYFTEFTTYQGGLRGTKNVSCGVIKNYNKVAARIELYQVHIKKTLTLENIDTEFYDSFTSFLVTKHGNGTNTIGSYIKILITFFNWCEKKKKIKLAEGVKDTLVVISEDNWFTYLEMEELDRLMDKDFSNSPIYERTCDAFCLQANFGCRYGDIKKIPSSIVLENFRRILKMKTGKNNSLVKVPVSKRAERLLKKYEGIDPEIWVPDNVLYNRYIKKVCELAKIDSDVVVSCGENDKRVDKVFKKWQLITTHTARRTFINLLLNRGVRDIDVCAMTGQSLRTINRYKHSNTENIENAIRLWDGDTPNAEPTPPERHLKVVAR